MSNYIKQLPLSSSTFPKGIYSLKHRKIVRRLSHMKIIRHLCYGIRVVLNSIISFAIGAKYCKMKQFAIQVIALVSL